MSRILSLKLDKTLQTQNCGKEFCCVSVPPTAFPVSETEKLIREVFNFSVPITISCGKYSLPPGQNIHHFANTYEEFTVQAASTNREIPTGSKLNVPTTTVPTVSAPKKTARLSSVERSLNKIRRVDSSADNFKKLTPSAITNQSIMRLQANLAVAECALIRCVEQADISFGED